MQDRFTDRAKKVMFLAHQEAGRLNHEYIGTEHLLIGLVKEGSGIACAVLRSFGLDINKVREEVDLIVRKGPEITTFGRLPLTPRAKRVVDSAGEYMISMGHKYVGTEHLLLGLLNENDNAAAQVIFNMGLTAEKIKAEIERLLGVKIKEVEEEKHKIKSCILCTKFEYCYATQSILDRTTGVLMGFMNAADAAAIARDVFKLIAPKCERYERKGKKDAK